MLSFATESNLLSAVRLGDFETDPRERTSDLGVTTHFPYQSSALVPALDSGPLLMQIVGGTDSGADNWVLPLTWGLH